MHHHGETAMTSSSPAVFSQPTLPETDAESLDTRFGRIQISRGQAITFPSGLLGMPDAVSFALATFPTAKMAERFTLLQSLQDPTLSFITLPLGVENNILSADDIRQAAGDLEIPVESLATLLIVTVSRDVSGAKLSVNARAPILVHLQTRLAGQYVFPHTKYEIRHAITL